MSDDPAIGPGPLATGPSRLLQREGGRDVAPRGAGVQGPQALPVGLHPASGPRPSAAGRTVEQELSGGRDVAPRGAGVQGPQALPVGLQRRALSRALRQHLDGLRTFGVDVVPTTATPSKERADSKAAQLAALADEVHRCRRCPLYRTRTHAVVSDGSSEARLVFVGEAPGRDEDLQGIPFVGAAGQLLTKMIIAMGLKREDVYICNVLKDRPPANRVPLPEEMEACLPFLDQQIAIVQPAVICTLGAVATKALLGPSVSITKIRGEVRAYRGIPLVPTFHPAYLLRNPAAKKDAWADLKQVKRLLDAAQ